MNGDEDASGPLTTRIEGRRTGDRVKPRPLAAHVLLGVEKRRRRIRYGFHAPRVAGHASRWAARSPMASAREPSCTRPAGRRPTNAIADSGSARACP